MEKLISSFDTGGVAVVIGATGGLGAQLLAQIKASGAFERVIGYGRKTVPAIDLTDEASITAAATEIAQSGLPLRLAVVASGVLHDARLHPEKSWRSVGPEGLAASFAVNAIGPMLIAKHFLPLLPRQGRAVFAALSAKVGSIEDNRLGGWYGYRASKAALNQLIRTAAIELARSHPEAVCITLHPGTVETPLSAPYSDRKRGAEVPAIAVKRLLAVIDAVRPEQSGAFLNHDGRPLPY